MKSLIFQWLYLKKIEKSDIDIDLSNFYQKARTLKISYDTSGEVYYNSYYDKEKNEISKEERIFTNIAVSTLRKRLSTNV
mgnify:CR=1 FL=1